MNKYNCGDKIVYSQYGGIRTGLIKEITKTTVIYYNGIESEPKFSYKVIYNDDEDNEYVIYNWVDQNDIIDYPLSDELFTLVKKVGKKAEKYKELSVQLRHDIEDIFKYPGNNDWRIEALKKKMDGLIPT